MRQRSATWDETHYLGVGAYLLHEGRWDVPSARLHPPLSFYLNSLPILLEGTGVSGFVVGDVARYRLGFSRGRDLLASSRHGPEGLLFRSRLPTVLVAAGGLLGQGIAEVKLCYFGTADPAQHRIAYLPLPGCASGPGPDPTREIVAGDVVAISATHPYPPFFAELGDLATHFRSREPIARVGYSIHLYRSDITRRLQPRPRGHDMRPGSGLR